MRGERNHVREASFLRSFFVVGIVGLSQVGCSTVFAPPPPGNLPDCEFPPSTQQCHATRSGPPGEGIRFNRGEH